ncbi:MAG: 4-hydroxybenzoate octaprenyltransferase [Asticcacaulis sp.]
MSVPANPLPIPPEPTEVLPDAAPSNWVDRYAPAALRPWLKLGRFDRPVGIWLLMLPGWMGLALAALQKPTLLQDGWDLIRLAGLFLIGSALMRAAGCAFNDIVDRDIDALVARTRNRPVASGQISAKQALGFIAVCSGLSALILLSLPPLCWGLGAASLLLVAAYPFMKRITWWPQAWLGLTFNWGALMGYAAATGTLSLEAGLLYIALVFWTLGYDTIYAIQDIEDDALAGVKSTARRLGDQTAAGVSLAYALCIGLIGMSLVFADSGPLGLLVLLFAAAHMGWQGMQVRLDDPVKALKLFKSNTHVGLIFILALLAAHWKG